MSFGPFDFNSKFQIMTHCVKIKAFFVSCAGLINAGTFDFTLN